MSYDSRPRSEGGKRGIDEDFSRKAPKGKFRVIGVDTFSGGDWMEGDFDTLDQAMEHANNETNGKKMLMMHVYDDTGSNRYHVGSM